MAYYQPSYSEGSEKQVSIFNATADTIAQLNTLLKEATKLREDGSINKYFHKLDSIYQILDSAMEKIEKNKREEYYKELEYLQTEINTGIRKMVLMKKQGKSSAGIMLTVYENLKKKERTLRRIREDTGLGIKYKGTDDDEMD